MVTISAPISAGQARAYHREEFQNAGENYYTEGDKIRGNGTAGLPRSSACAEKSTKSTSHDWLKANILIRANNWYGIKRCANTPTTRAKR